MAVMQPEIQPESSLEPTTSSIPDSNLVLPPGLVGEMAAYFYSTAIRPVPEIALSAAIGFMAGLCGRAFNISGSGLNQYIILLAKTGSGKEGAQMGIENLLAAVRTTVPMADQFLGPAAFASGQALIKVLNDKPCFVSILGEFGLTLQQLSDHRANSAQIMLRKVLLDLYAKSGWNRMLRSSVYSDTDKNTKIIQAPNVTILGESTPETFFEGLDASHIAEGLIPRFSIMEYTGKRPPRNPNVNVPPSQDLTQRVADLVTTSLTTSNNNTMVEVRTDDHSQQLLDAFDVHADEIMNSSHQDVEVQLWNRAHLKALKLAALLAVGCHPYQPIITSDLAQWAIDFVTRDVNLVVRRFQDGNVGKGDSKQFHDLRKVVQSYFGLNKDTLDKRKMDRRMHKDKIVPYSYLIRKTASVASFRTDRMGATSALKRTIQALVDSNMLLEVAPQTLVKQYKFHGSAYAIGFGWNSGY